MVHNVARHTFEEVMVPNYAPSEIIPVRGQGTRVWDQAGKEYIDFAGGIAVTALGHCHPELQQVLNAQGAQLWHVSNGWTNEPALRLAEDLCQLTFADRVFFANSGAEANEAALKLARKYARDHYNADKHEIIAFNNSFHGRTLFTVSTGGQADYSRDFAPLPAGITHLPYNDLASLEYQISDSTCAVILELIQGEGGVIPAEPAFVKGVRELCDKYNALLIIDEIQTGMGRTGTLFAYQQHNITPDILTSAKALGGGFPVAAMLTLPDIAESFSVGSHGSTFGGNPLACAVAGKALSLISDPTLLAGVKQRHQLFLDGLQQLNKKISIFQEIRGQGLLIGCELKSLWHGKARELQRLAQEQGVLVLAAGPNVMRLTPALNIAYPEINKGLKQLAQAMLALKMGF